MTAHHETAANATELINHLERFHELGYSDDPHDPPRPRFGRRRQARWDIQHQLKVAVIEAKWLASYIHNRHNLGPRATLERALRDLRDTLQIHDELELPLDLADQHDNLITTTNRFLLDLNDYRYDQRNQAAPNQ